MSRRVSRIAIELFGADFFQTGVNVDDDTSTRVRAFQEDLRILLGEKRRPNQAVTAGFLLRKGLELAQDLGVPLTNRPAPSRDRHLMIIVDKETWARVNQYAVCQNSHIYVEVPALINLALDLGFGSDAGGRA